MANSGVSAGDECDQVGLGGTQESGTQTFTNIPGESFYLGKCKEVRL